MAESTSRASQQSTARQDAPTDWEALAPIAVDYEDSMNPKQVQDVWLVMYKYAGLRAPSEDLQKGFRLAVYQYAAINGTSREGAYSGRITMSNGHSFDASVIVRATGKMMIRKFFRGNMLESYEALKRSRVLEKDERFVAKAAQYGVAAKDVVATADWFANCPTFTPSEKLAYDAAFHHSISRARRNRGGQNLEEVEGQRLEKGLEVQGVLDAPTGDGRITF